MGALVVNAVTTSKYHRTTNPLQDEPKDKPLPRNIIHPDCIESAGVGNRKDRRNGMSQKTG